MSYTAVTDILESLSYLGVVEDVLILTPIFVLSILGSYLVYRWIEKC